LTYLNFGDGSLEGREVLLEHLLSSLRFRIHFILPQHPRVKLILARGKCPKCWRCALRKTRGPPRTPGFKCAVQGLASMRVWGSRFNLQTGNDSTLNAKPREDARSSSNTWFEVRGLFHFTTPSNSKNVSGPANMPQVLGMGALRDARSSSNIWRPEPREC
jgi:hypothetical protein